MINNFKLIRDLKPGSVFLVKDGQGEQFVLKQNPVADRLVKFSQMVQQKGGDLAELMPEFFAKDGWLWQKFLPWELAGDTVKTYGIEKNSFKYIDPEKLGRAIGELQKLGRVGGDEFARKIVTRHPLKKFSLETRQSDFYLKNIGEFKPALMAEFGIDFFTKVEQFLLSQKNLVDQHSHFLANGDLHPQNIMYSRNELPSSNLDGILAESSFPCPANAGRVNKFMIIDWDLLHLNNPGWDLCDLYVWGWRDSSWGERLLKDSKKSVSMPMADFEKIFAFDLVYLASQLIKHAKLIQAPKEFFEAQKKLLLVYLA